jgi:protein phosphatase
MKYTLKVYSIWEFGQRVDSLGQPHQEDSLYPEFGLQSDNDRLFILCDGMGGHDAGEVASATVCEAMSASILADGHDADGIFTHADLDKAIADAYDALDRHDTGAGKKMGTTMTLLKLHNGGATIAHIGDSRVYHLRPGQTGEDTRILFHTEDHSLVNALIKAGEMTREEARHSKQRNVITRAMQPNQSPRCRADVYSTDDILPGDYFYLCSDGMLEQDEMEDGTVLRRIFSDEVANDSERIEILRGATKENRDNHTAFVVHILSVEKSAMDSDVLDSSAVSSSEDASVVSGKASASVVSGEDTKQAPEADSMPKAAAALKQEATAMPSKPSAMPETTTPKPEVTASNPTQTPKPEATAMPSKPEVTASKPTQARKLEATAMPPKPEVSASKPEVTASKPTQARKLEATAMPPKPEVSASKPEVTASKPMQTPKPNTNTTPKPTQTPKSEAKGAILPKQHPFWLKAVITLAFVLILGIIVWLILAKTDLAKPDQQPQPIEEQPAQQHAEATRGR